MVEAYSRLGAVLTRKNMGLEELHDRLRLLGVDVKPSALHRLARPDRPLGTLDLRLAGAICQACDIPLSRLIRFSTADAVKPYPPTKQKRLDQLMDRNNNGALTKEERLELSRLVGETQELAVENARRLVRARRRPAAGRK